MYLFDTNIFLEILLDQKQTLSCRKALAALDSDSPGWITGFSLHAIEAILGRNLRYRIPLERFLRNLSENQLLHRYDTTTEEEGEIASSMPRLKLDFDDALQYYVARKERLTLVTLDRDFDKISDVKILKPYDFV